MPARPTTIAARGRVRSNSNVISDASALTIAPLIPGLAGGEHLGPLADFRGAHFPPGMAALGPRIRVDLDVDEVSAVRVLGAFECRLERRDVGDRFAVCPHGTGVLREVNRKGRMILGAVSKIVVERDVAGGALQLVDDGEAAVIAKHDD